MLCIWLSGAGARSMERDSDEEVLEKVSNLMRRFLSKGYPNMQDPIGILVCFS